MKRYRAFALILFSICLLLRVESVPAQTPQHVFSLPDVQTFQLSEHRDRVAIMTTDGQITIWSILSADTSLTLVVTLEGTPLATRMTTYDLTWGGDDRFVGAGFADGARVWDAQTGQLLYAFNNHPVDLRHETFSDSGNHVTTIAISRDGRFIATGSWYDSTVLLYDTQQSEVVYSLSEHRIGNDSAGIDQLLFSADDKTLFVRQWTDGVVIWDITTRERLFSEFLSAETMTINPDSTRLATGFGRLVSTIRVWDIPSGNSVTSVSVPLVATQMAWSSDGEFVYVRVGGGLLVHDGYAYNGESVRQIAADTGEEVRAFALYEEVYIPYELQQGETILGIGIAHAENQLLLWNRIDEEIYRRELDLDAPRYPYIVATQRIHDFALNDDDSLLAAGHETGLTIWDTSTGEITHAIETESAISSIALADTPTSVIVLALSGDGLLHVIDSQCLLH